VVGCGCGMGWLVRRASVARQSAARNAAGRPLRRALRARGAQRSAAGGRRRVRAPAFCCSRPRRPSQPHAHVEFLLTRCLRSMACPMAAARCVACPKAAAAASSARCKRFTCDAAPRPARCADCRLGQRCVPTEEPVAHLLGFSLPTVDAARTARASAPKPAHNALLAVSGPCSHIYACNMLSSQTLACVAARGIRQMIACQ
jgi:hypothetical protein